MAKPESGRTIKGLPYVMSAEYSDYFTQSPTNSHNLPYIATGLTNFLRRCVCPEWKPLNRGLCPPRSSYFAPIWDPIFRAKRGDDSPSLNILIYDDDHPRNSHPDPSLERRLRTRHAIELNPIKHDITMRWYVLSS